MFRKKKSKSSLLSSDAQKPSDSIKTTPSSNDFIDIKNFEKHEKKIQLNTSEFYEISDKNTNNKYVAHILLERVNDLSKQKLIQISTNLNTISKLNHPTILKYIGFSPADFDKQPKPTIIYENFRDSLNNFMLISSKEQIKLGWTHTKKFIFIYNIALAMSYLHSHDFIHGNLNPDTIFIDYDLNPKISGFEFSRKCSDPSISRFSQFNKPQFLAPEVLSKREYSKSSDVYSFAMIVFEIITKSAPFTYLDTTFQCIHQIAVEGERPDIKAKTPKFYKELIKRCWSQDASQRPSFDQIVEELRTNSNKIDEKIKLEKIQNYFEQIEKETISFNPNNRFNHFDTLIELNLMLQKELDTNHIYALEDKSLNYESLNIEDFNQLQNIDHYLFDEIHKLENKKTGFFYLGRFSEQIEDLYKHEVINFTRELNILCQLNHPSIMKFIGYSPNESVVISEYMLNGTLDFVVKKLNKTEIWDDTQKLITIYGIASGIAYLHSHNILHRDLKSKNIEFNDFFLPKIKGFNISVKMDDLDGTELKGTPAYIAPELFKEKKYSKASDVYSFSLIIYEIMTNEIPFNDLSNAFQVFDEIVQKNNRPCIPDNVPKAYKKLIENCWSTNPEERPTFDQILSELKTNPEFITNKVNSNDFFRYVKFIDNSKDTFDSTKRIHQFDEIIESKYEQFNETRLNTNVLDIYSTETCNISLEFEYFDLSQFQTTKKIGSGSFSMVYEIQNNDTGIKYAAKIFGDEIKNKDSLKYLKREVSALSQLHHPSIVKFIGYSPVDFKNKPFPVIITELSTNKSLDKTLKLVKEGNTPQDWDDTKKLINIYGIASAMEYLHSIDIIFRDLKPNNILFDDYLFPKIIDFGLIKFTNEKNLKNKEKEYASFQGTVCYMAPEIMTEETTKLSKACDVYSFAITVYEIMTNLAPYKSDQRFYQFITNVTQGMRPEFKTPIPDCYRELIERCWSPDPNERPTFKEIVSELKCNSDFVTKSVNELDFINYVDYIDESRKSFYYCKPSQKQDDEYEEIIKRHFPSFCKVNIFADLNEKKEIKKLKINVPSIKLDQYEKQRKIGEGCFGNVYKIIEKTTQQIFAAKISKNNLDLCDDAKVRDLEREINIISALNFPSIMKFIGFNPNNFKNKPKPIIITELLSNGSLGEIIELERNNCGHPDWDDTKRLINIYGIASGMKYLHSKNILHRDLKPDNILLDDNLYPKIADFGLSKDLSINSPISEENNRSGVKGTPAYCSPEIFKEKYTKAGDVYAFAMIAYEIMTSEVIFENMNQWQLIIQIMNGIRPTPKYEIPSAYHELINECWQNDPESRPTFDEIVERLKTEQKFITENIDEDEFLNYVDLVNETNSLISNCDSKQESTKTHQKNKKSKKKTKSKHHSKKHHKTSENNKNNDNDQQDMTLEKSFLDINKFELSDLICKSDFFKTYKVVCKETKIVYSAKISTVKHNKFSKDEIKDLSKEIDIVSQMKHPSFLKFIGYSLVDFKMKRHPIIVTELTLNGSLEHILKVEKEGKTVTGWDLTKKLINIYGIASGMSYLHKNDIIHKDLNPNNIFLDDYLFPKIGDFGLSSRYHKFDNISFQSISGLKGSPAYSSPEILQFNQYSKSGDVYSFGMVVFEIVTNEVPFEKIKNINEIYNEVVNKNRRPNIKESIPESYRNLIERCWSQNADERPSFDEIINLLKTDLGFITEKVFKEDYLKYIEFIDKFESEVDHNKKILNFEEFLNIKTKIDENEVILESDQMDLSDGATSVKIVE